MTAPFDNALIMAAGRGMRMMPLTQDLPKAMAPYNGSTLIAEGIAKVSGRIRDVHVTVGHHGAMLAQHVIEHGARTVINTDGRGNAWWLYNTFLALLDEPLLVLTCDTVMELDFGLLADEYVARGEPACMLVPVPPVAGVDGDYLTHDDERVVTRISRDEPTDLYCSGIQVVHPARIGALTEPAEDFTGVWAQLLPRRELRVSRVYPQRWTSVDTVEQLEALAED